MHKRTLSSFLANRTYEPHFIIVHYSENFVILISSPCVILMLCKYLWVEKMLSCIYSFQDAVNEVG